jgi:uncharacterized protein (TIGR00369 family)
MTTWCVERSWTINPTNKKSNTRRSRRRDGIDVGARIRPRDLREVIAGAADHADGRAVRLHGRPRYRRHPQRAGSLRHYNPIGSVHGGYAAILLNSVMGLAMQSTLPVGTGYATLEFKISFVRGMSEKSGVVRTEGRVLNAGRRVATAEARITDAKDRLLAHATTTCLVFEIMGNAKG